MVCIFMIKIGIIFEAIGFIMMFWHSVARPVRTLKNNDGKTTGYVSEEQQMNAIFKFIPSQKLRNKLIDNFLGIAILMLLIGVILQILSLSR